MNDNVLPITMRIKDAVSYVGLSRATLYRLVGQGQIVFKKSAGRTLVCTQSLIEYTRNLPEAPIRKVAA